MAVLEFDTVGWGGCQSVRGLSTQQWVTVQAETGLLPKPERWKRGRREGGGFDYR